MGMKADSVGLMAKRVRDEQLEAAKRVAQTAKEQGEEMILLTGDVFEDTLFWKPKRELNHLRIVEDSHRAYCEREGHGCCAKGVKTVSLS